MIAYDMDGVLAEAPPPSDKPWGKMKGWERENRQALLLQHYERAKSLFLPPEDKFVVISARKSTPLVGDVTLEWLQNRFASRLAGLFLLREARSLENVIRFKAGVLAQIGATAFTEDNLKVLKGIQKTGSRCALYFFNGTERKLL